MAFGEVWVAELTKFLAKNPQIVVVEGFSLASGEMLGSNLTSPNAQKFDVCASRGHGVLVEVAIPLAIVMLMTVSELLLVL